jgi:hypothetical protein
MSRSRFSSTGITWVSRWYVFVSPLTSTRAIPLDVHLDLERLKVRHRDDRATREPPARDGRGHDLADLRVLAQHRPVERRADDRVLEIRLGNSHRRVRRLDLRTLELHARLGGLES